MRSAKDVVTAKRLNPVTVGEIDKMFRDIEHYDAGQDHELGMVRLLLEKVWDAIKESLA